MIRLISLIVVHILILVGLGLGASSKPSQIPKSEIPGYELCDGNESIGFDRDCMRRNSDRIGEHVRANPPPAAPPEVSPVWAPAVTLVFALVVWNIAFNISSKAGIFVVTAAYTLSALSGVFGLLDILAVMLSGFIMLILYLGRGRKNNSMVSPID